MKSLKIDLDQLQSTITCYETAISDLTSAFKDMENAIDLLKGSGWESGASTKYFSLFDTSWKSNMDRHLRIIKHLKECLANAKKEYQTVYERVRTLGRSL